MPLNPIKDLSTVTTTATALSNLVLVTPQKNRGYGPVNPSNGKSIGEALLFHYEGENTSSLQSDITDHYVEDNTAVADQIALKPETVTVRGYIGELNNVVPFAERGLTALKQKLTVISAYAPSLSVTAMLLYNQAFQAYQIIENGKKAISSWGTLNKSGLREIGSNGLTGKSNDSQTRQQIAYQQFYGYWRGKTLFTIQTPWAIFQNMAISSIQATQDEDTNMISEFSITFKMIRFAKTKKELETPYDPIKMDERAYNHGAESLEKGSVNTSSAGSATSLWS